MVARPVTSATRVRRHTRAVPRHRRASHPTVTSLAPSIATDIPTTASGAPATSTTIPLIEKKAAAPGRTTAATYAAISMPAKWVTGTGRARVTRTGHVTRGVTGFGAVTGAPSATMTVLPRRVTSPAFCHAFRRRL